MKADDAGKLVLRVILGLLILLHGIAKLRFGLGDVAASLARAGLPAALGYLVFLGEVVAPVMLILGWLTRAVAVIVAMNMAVALVVGHWGHIFQVEPHGGLLLEVQFMFLFAASAVALLGAGRWSLGGPEGRWN